MDALSVPGDLPSLELVARWLATAAAEAHLSKLAASRLRLAVDEVVTNIVVHGYHEGGLTGDMQLRAENDGKTLRIVVEDTAPPFDPFSLSSPQDLDKALEERELGGLGVFLAMESVDEFKYERAGDRNRNIFVVNLPTADVASGTEQIEKSAPQGPWVLVLDDDAGNREQAAGMLATCDYQVMVADSLPEALRQLSQQPADAMLLNLHSSISDPLEWLRYLKSNEAGAIGTVIVTSPVDNPQGVMQALEMGADDFLVGPAHPDILRARIEASIGVRRLRHQLERELVEELRVTEVLRISEKLERDIQIGRQIQMSFLPESLPVLSGWELASRFRPAREVAGDWYDAFNLEHIRRVGLVIADVADKGVGPAMFMALMRSLIRAFAQQPSSLRWLDALDIGEAPSPEAPRARRRIPPTAGSTALRNAMEQTNNYIAKTHGDTGMFATLFFGLLDPVTGLLQYVNGGHEPPIIIGANGVKSRLPPSGMAVGIMEGSEYTLESVQLDPGDMLLAYTDGVTDARDPNRKFFTEKRLLTLVEQVDPTADGLLDRIMKELDAHIADADQFDDITMLAVKRLLA
ncbi:MAG: phosphoserine phosphatase RsbU/P [Chloroflexota bacterium]|nr:phosphoserine phosphatase RsbU/P [Chloroflexota bacterium]